MPGGPSPVGFGYFLVAKFAGYTAFCAFAIKPRLQRITGSAQEKLLPPSWLAGLARTLIGLAVGVLVGLSFWALPWSSRDDGVAIFLFFVLLIPIRVGEWWLLLRWTYKNFTATNRNGLIAGGILTSFALDALGVAAALVLPGGAWVC